MANENSTPSAAPKPLYEFQLLVFERRIVWRVDHPHGVEVFEARTSAELEVKVARHLDAVTELLARLPHLRLVAADDTGGE